MTKTALITGITGQDGAYLSKVPLDKSYEVFGTYRRLSTPNFWRLQYLAIFEKVNKFLARRLFKGKEKDLDGSQKMQMLHLHHRILLSQAVQQG